LELTCVPATPADLREIWAIEKDLADAWTFKQLLAEFELAPGWSFVVKSPSLLLGYIFGSKVADEAEIHKIAVISAYRRRGLADILLSTAFSYLAAQGTFRCFLEVRQSNKAAICLYQKYQFTQIGTRKNYYTSPLDNAILLKKGILPLVSSKHD